MNGIYDENSGAMKRSNLTVEGKKVDKIGYIHDDVFRHTILQHPYVIVKLRFVWSTEQFSRTSTKVGYNTDIFSAVIYVKKCKVNPEVGLALGSVHKKEQHAFSNNTSEL